MAEGLPTKEDALKSLFSFAEEHSDSTEGENSPLHQSLLDITDRYETSKVIGRGGMKVVSKVFDSTMGRDIAMATLHNNASEELYEPFLREARLTALLDHPNIISIFDIGLDADSIPYFTMELKTGQGLDTLIKKLHRNSCNSVLALIDINQLLEIFLKICDGMAYAHSQNIIHLDLKPENIQVGLYGEVIICDWGLGKIIGSSDYDGGDFDQLLFNPDLLNNMTKFSTIRGTPGYMAPEQVHGKIDKNAQTDIYSLGALLYTMLTNRTPINVCEQEKALDDTLQGNIIIPNKQIPASLSSVVMKALALCPEDRYASVESIRGDIYSFMTGYSTSAENAGLIKECTLFFNRNRIVSLVIILAFIVLSLTSGIFILSLNKSKLAAEKAQLQAESSQVQATLEKERATKEKERAERVLELYTLEKEKGTAFVEEHFSLLQNRVYQFTDVEIYSDAQLWLNKALSYLNLMIDNNPSERWPYMQRGYVYFLMQEFEKADADFARYSVGATVIYGISKRFAQHSTSGNPLPPEKLTHLFKELSRKIHHNAQVIIMMLYDRSIRDSAEAHSKVVETVLAIHNSKWKDKTFLFNAKTQSLKISGKHLSKLIGQGRLKKAYKISSIQLLQTLNLKTLDLRGSEIYRLNQLAGLKITHLDIRDTLINNCASIKKYLPHLKRIVVSKGQLKSNDPVFKVNNLEVVKEDLSPNN